MSTASDLATPAFERTRRLQKEKLFARIGKASTYLNIVGLGWIVPLLRIAAGDSPKQQLKQLWQLLVIPLMGIAAFLILWGAVAPRVTTSLGVIPGPTQVWIQTVNLYKDHLAERQRATEFYAREAERNAQLVASGQRDKVRLRAYTGKPTYLDQIVTSLLTVGLGFVVATLVAVPLGIVCGLSKSVNGALNPLIQIFRPVSPLAWLPIVTMIVSALYLDPIEWLPKSLVISAITVTLCSLWPTLINTALGVQSVDRDLMNVGRVLRLPTWKTVTKLILPSALPLIFTGLRLSLGVGWMVLIAAEMLAQNPGLGKFVWDEFQNGSSSSLAKIMVAVLTIGLIGFLLDRIMCALQTAFTYSTSR
jgi:nitrate/nitrite transport system permease protein